MNETYTYWLIISGDWFVIWRQGKEEKPPTVIGTGPSLDAAFTAAQKHLLYYEELRIPLVFAKRA